MFNAAANATKYEVTGQGRESAGTPGGRGRHISILNPDGSAKGTTPQVGFCERVVPLSPATRGGLLVFVLFLLSFSAITLLERNDHVYYFAEHTRQLIGVNSFRRLQEQRMTYREYQTWFSYHFMDGLANVRLCLPLISHPLCLTRICACLCRFPPAWTRTPQSCLSARLECAKCVTRQTVRLLLRWWVSSRRVASSERRQSSHLACTRTTGLANPSPIAGFLQARRTIFRTLAHTVTRLVPYRGQAISCLIWSAI